MWKVIKGIEIKSLKKVKKVSKIKKDVDGQGKFDACGGDKFNFLRGLTRHLENKSFYVPSHHGGLLSIIYWKTVYDDEILRLSNVRQSMTKYLTLTMGKLVWQYWGNFDEKKSVKLLLSVLKGTAIFNTGYSGGANKGGIRKSFWAFLWGTKNTCCNLIGCQIILNQNETFVRMPTVHCYQKNIYEITING